MVVKKPRIVIIGAGMAGLTAANKLYRTIGVKGGIELCVIEGGNRIGGRISTFEFGGDRVEMGATWIHGIGGSPVYEIAQEFNSMESDMPWECMDGFLDDPITIAENGCVLDDSLVDPLSILFKNLMDFAQGKRNGIGFDGNGIGHVGNGIGDEIRDGIGDEIKNGIGNEGNGIGYDGIRIGDEIKNGIGNEGNGIGNEGIGIGDEIKNGIGNEGNGIGDEIRNGIGNEGNGIGNGKMSVGSFLRKGLEDYWERESRKEKEEVNGNGIGNEGNGNWDMKSIEEAIFAMQENTQRTYTSANDLYNLDYNAESEYVMFPGEEITIPKGYSSIIESLASILPNGVIQLGKKVCKIEWQNQENGQVKLHFLDGTTLSADHVIVTVSLGVLKAGICNSNDSTDSTGSTDSTTLKFIPPLPDCKIDAISRLGYGVVNKLFMQLSQDLTEFDEFPFPFPFLQLVFHQSDSQFKNSQIPWWIRRTASVSPIYKKSRVLLSWFAGEEALQLETLSDEVILDDVTTTLSSFLTKSSDSSKSHEQCNGNGIKNPSRLNLVKVLKSKWGSDPLFLGSYSYVAVGSSGFDIDTLAEPLIKTGSHPLQILFAGEATHRTHYSTTHGAYLSGIREANRLIEHYQCME